MSGSVKVKVRRAVLIKHLEKALAERKSRYENQEKAQEQHKVAMKKYHAEILKLIKTKGVITDASSHYFRQQDDDSHEISATVSLPKSVKLPKVPEAPECYRDYEWRRDREGIEQAIRVLTLAEDEFVGASTYNSVSQYL